MQSSIYSPRYLDYSRLEACSEILEIGRNFVVGAPFFIAFERLFRVISWCFPGSGPQSISKLFWGRFWKQITQKKSAILEPKFNIFGIDFITHFWYVSLSRFGDDFSRFGVEFRGYLGYFFSWFSWLHVRIAISWFLKDLPCVFQYFEGSEDLTINKKIGHEIIWK